MPAKLTVLRKLKNCILYTYKEDGKSRRIKLENTIWKLTESTDLHPIVVLENDEDPQNELEGDGEPNELPPIELPLPTDHQSPPVKLNDVGISNHPFIGMPLSDLVVANAAAPTLCPGSVNFEFSAEGLLEVTDASTSPFIIASTNVKPPKEEKFSPAAVANTNRARRLDDLRRFSKSNEHF